MIHDARSALFPDVCLTHLTTACGCTAERCRQSPSNQTPLMFLRSDDLAQSMKTGTTFLLRETDCLSTHVRCPASRYSKQTQSCLQAPPEKSDNKDWVRHHINYNKEVYSFLQRLSTKNIKAFKTFQSQSNPQKCFQVASHPDPLNQALEPRRSTTSIQSPSPKQRSSPSACSGFSMN